MTSDNKGLALADEFSDAMARLGKVEIVSVTNF